MARNTPAQNATLEFYKDERGEVRWRLLSENGNVVAESGEGYKRRASAEKGFNSLYHAILALPGPASNVSVRKRQKAVSVVTH